MTFGGSLPRHHHLRLHIRTRRKLGTRGGGYVQQNPTDYRLYTHVLFYRRLRIITSSFAFNCGGSPIRDGAPSRSLWFLIVRWCATPYPLHHPTPAAASNARRTGTGRGMSGAFRELMRRVGASAGDGLWVEQEDERASNSFRMGGGNVHHPR